MEKGNQVWRKNQLKVPSEFLQNNLRWMNGSQSRMRMQKKRQRVSLPNHVRGENTSGSGTYCCRDLPSKFTKCSTYEPRIKSCAGLAQLQQALCLQGFLHQNKNKRFWKKKGKTSQKKIGWR